jgi:hypothetical protein
VPDALPPSAVPPPARSADESQPSTTATIS